MSSGPETLTEKVAIISGAARGMGAAQARRFVELGGQVVIGDVLSAEGEALASELGPNASFTLLDVRSEEDWGAAVAAAKERYGRLNVLVNNAGIGRMSPIAETSLDSYMDVVEVNQIGVFLGMRAVIPEMLSAGNGSIINIASVEGQVGIAGGVAYCASKHAVLGMTKVGALELTPQGIRVNAISPGVVDTPLVRSVAEAYGLDVVTLFSSKVPMGRLGHVDEIAHFVCFLASEKASYCSGASYVVDGGVIAG
jgi:3alpha(or 20beta)-hydroxysteroid dehydrogenase